MDPIRYVFAEPVGPVHSKGRAHRTATLFVPDPLYSVIIILRLPATSPRSSLHLHAIERDLSLNRDPDGFSGVLAVVTNRSVVRDRGVLY